MALSGFEIATGGITSIPVTATLIFLGYKAFGEKNLDTTKYKPKKPAQTKKAEPSQKASESKMNVVPKKDTDTKKTAMIIAVIPTVKASTALWVTHYLAFGLLYRCGGSDRIFTIFPKFISN